MFNVGTLNKSYTQERDWPGGYASSIAARVRMRKTSCMLGTLWGQHRDVCSELGWSSIGPGIKYTSRPLLPLLPLSVNHNCLLLT